MAHKTVLITEELHANLKELEIKSYGVKLDASMAEKLKFLYDYFMLDELISDDGVSLHFRRRIQKNNGW